MLLFFQIVHVEQMVKARRRDRRKYLEENLCKNSLPQRPLVQGADTAAYSCHNMFLFFCFFLLLWFVQDILKHSWSDLQAANRRRFASQLKDIVTG